jgi:hypothetical protein
MTLNLLDVWPMFSARSSVSCSLKLLQNKLVRFDQHFQFAVQFPIFKHFCQNKLERSDKHFELAAQSPILLNFCRIS